MMFRALVSEVGIVPVSGSRYSMDASLMPSRLSCHVWRWSSAIILPPKLT